MSFLKFVTDLFLEKQELNRFAKFLVDEGFRLHLLQNSFSFGIIKTKDDFNLDNYKVEAGTNSGTIKIANDSFALDKDGLIIFKEPEDNIAVPDDGDFHWIKISHVFSPKEDGEVSINANGELSGVGTEFLTILRGQPNFPSKIAFIGSTLNTDEYEVVEVIDDTNVILSGSFQAEVDLEFKVIGTFTPGTVPDPSDKDIFQYDSVNFEQIVETVLNTAPTAGFTQDKNFYIARVKNTGGVISIEDKRTEFWRTKADFEHTFIDKLSNPLIRD